MRRKEKDHWGGWQTGEGEGEVPRRGKRKKGLSALRRPKTPPPPLFPQELRKEMHQHPLRVVSLKGRRGVSLFLDDRRSIRTLFLICSARQKLLGGETREERGSNQEEKKERKSSVPRRGAFFLRGWVVSRSFYRQQEERERDQQK